MDATGVLHHVMARGIEGSKIFRNQADRKSFLGRVAELCEEEAWLIYAWALMPNHFHLLVRTGRQPLSSSMRKLLTGYVVNFNRKYDRKGHLFQNRYKSVICEDDPYLLELTRYIHLNPLRGGLVPDIQALNSFAWSGHSALVGRIERPWQSVDEVLAYFGSRKGDAIRHYLGFVVAGIPQGRRPELLGGGLIRSVGGWSEVLSMRRHGIRVKSDERVLGSSDFVERLLAEAEEKQRQTLRLQKEVPDLDSLAAQVAEEAGVTTAAMRHGGRKRVLVQARRVFCRRAVVEIGYTGADVARYLGMTTSSVTRLAHSDSLSDVTDETA